MRPVSHVNRRKQIHELLAQHPDGLTRAEIMAALDMSSDQFNATTKTMPYVYIDRWAAKRLHQPNGGSRVKWVAVYCMTDLPPDAPMPERKPTEEDLA
jgi:hypothetical protein